MQTCRLCKHYMITHDVQAPYGCNVMGFKSSRLPERIVQEASGEPCHYFEAKQGRHDKPSVVRQLVVRNV